MARIKLTIRRREPPRLVTRDGVFPNALEATFACGICGADIHAFGNRNFVPPVDDEPARIDGSTADHCNWCTAKTPGLRFHGRDANISYRDAQHITAAMAFANALEREAKHAR